MKYGCILVCLLLSSCAFYTYKKHGEGKLHVEAPRDAVREIHEAPGRVIYPRFKNGGLWLFWRKNNE